MSNWTSPVRFSPPRVLVVSCCAVPPLYVGILRTGNPLVAGLPRTLECQVLVLVVYSAPLHCTVQATGARPRPRISWWKDGQPLRESEIQVHLSTVQYCNLPIILGWRTKCKLKVWKILSIPRN